jgi:hypothetical protein
MLESAREGAPDWIVISPEHALAIPEVVVLALNRFTVVFRTRIF